MTRRDLLRSGASLALLPFAGSEALAKPKGRFRFVHLTDLHIQPELGAPDGVAMAVKKILALRPRPQFVITGGDHVMDVLSVPSARAELQFRLLAEALKPLEIPVYAAVGNHDVYGWSDKAMNQSDPGYGKKMFEEKMAKGPSTRAWSQGGWKFLVLDTIQPRANGGWRAAIDDDQLSWLKGQLEASGPKTPTVVVAHVPLVTAFPLYHESSTGSMGDGMIVANGKEVVDLLSPYNVKAVLQGHTHIVEDIDYNGTRYITSGAICGDWWKGARLGIHPEGFMVFDVDGDRLKSEYVTYGWKARS